MRDRLAVAAQHTGPAAVERLLNNNCHARMARCIFPGLASTDKPLRFSMPFCPECECEYAPGVEKCPICATSLVDTLNEESTCVCDECKSEIPGDARSCPVCGTVFIDDLRCLAHPAEPAHGRCVVCGQHLCSDCESRRLGRYFCERHGSEEKPPEEEILYRAEDREALNYRRALAQRGVESRVFSAEQDTGMVLGRGLIEVARIIVPSKYREAARKWMESRSIDDGHVLFQCERCSALNGFDTGGCANCGGR